MGSEGSRTCLGTRKILGGSIRSAIEGRQSVRQRIIITIIFQKSGQQTIGPVIGNGRVSISPFCRPFSLSLPLSLHRVSRHHRRGSKARDGGGPTIGQPRPANTTRREGPGTVTLQAVCVAIPYLSLHLCNPRFIADDYARMEVRGGGGGVSPSGARSVRDIERSLSIDVATPSSIYPLSMVIQFSLYLSLFLLLSSPSTLYLTTRGRQQWNMISYPFLQPRHVNQIYWSRGCSVSRPLLRSFI